MAECRCAYLGVELGCGTIEANVARMRRQFAVHRHISTDSLRVVQLLPKALVLRPYKPDIWRVKSGNSDRSPISA